MISGEPTRTGAGGEGNALRIEVEMGAINEVESPEEVFGGAIRIGSARVIREVLAEWRTLQLLHEQIDLVQEEDDARPHKPSGVDDRVE